MTAPITNRMYEVYVVLGNPALIPPWVETTWCQLASVLDPLSQSDWGQAAVRSMQMRSGPGSPNRRGISFGRIGWNERGHRKWVHASATPEDIEKSVIFYNAEIWSPSWTHCEQAQRYPDAYFVMSNEAVARGPNVAFNPTCLLAVAQDLPADLVDLGRECAIGMATILQAIVRVSSRRLWRAGTDPITKHKINNINDLIVSGLFKPGSRHGQPVDSHLLNGEWLPF